MNPKVLIVEDDPKILFNLKSPLEFSDYKTITTANGIEVLEILSKLDMPL